MTDIDVPQQTKLTTAKFAKPPTPRHPEQTTVIPNLFRDLKQRPVRTSGLALFIYIANCKISSLINSINFFYLQKKLIEFIKYIIT